MSNGIIKQTTAFGHDQDGTSCSKAVYKPV